MRTIPPRAWVPLFKKTFAAWSDDYAASMGAAIAYYTIFSLAPLLVIVLAVAGLVFGRDAAAGELFGELKGFLGSDGAIAIQALVESASHSGQGVVSIIASIAVMVFGATGVFSELQSAIDRIWKVPKRARSSTWIELLRTRLLAFGMVLSVAFLLVVSLAISAGISAMGAVWNRWIGGWELVLQLVNVTTSLIIFTGVFAAMYRFLPRAQIPWRDVWLGASITAAMFVIGKFLIGLYIGKSGILSGFGAAGSIVTLLIWVYYSAQIFLLGAEFTRIHSQGTSADSQN